MEKRFYSHEDKRQMLERQEYMCGECGTDLWRDPIGKNQGHHILPFSMGGETSVENGIVLCQLCHQLHDALAICGHMYGGDYGIYDMQEEQIRNPYLALHSIPKAEANEKNPDIQKHIRKLKNKIYGKHGTIYERKRA